MSKNALERLKEDENRYNKKKCRQLREIRKELADKLNIDLHQTECTFKGDCSGTCPKCEQEEQILNKALAKIFNSKKDLIVELPGIEKLESVTIDDPMSSIIDTDEFRFSGKIDISDKELNAKIPEINNTQFVRTGAITPPIVNKNKGIKKENESNVNDSKGDLVIELPEKEEEEFIMSGVLLPPLDLRNK